MRIIALFRLGIPLLATGQQSLPVATLIQQFKTSQVFWQQFEAGQTLVKIHDRAS